MEYKILEAIKVENENIDGAEFNNFVSGGQNGIIGGVLSNCDIIPIENSVTMLPGLIVIQGFRIKILSSYTHNFEIVPALDIDYEMVGQLKLNTDGSTFFNIVVRQPKDLVQEELFKKESGIYETVFATFTLKGETGNIENLEQQIEIIEIKGGGGGGGGDVTKEYVDNGLAQKEDKWDNISSDIKVLAKYMPINGDKTTEQITITNAPTEKAIPCYDGDKRLKTYNGDSDDDCVNVLQLNYKQDKTDNALTTTDKTVIGAINEDKGIADSKQESGENALKNNQLENGKVYITKAVNDITNYYKKSETYTQAEINSKISAIPKFAIKVVTTLPTSNISETTVYLVPDINGQSPNLYQEWLYVKQDSGAYIWEKLGSQTVDLTDYAKKSYVDTGFATKGEVNNKVTKNNTANNVYETGDKIRALALYPTASAIPLYNGNRCLKTDTPIYDNDAVNKKYVDDKIPPEQVNADWNATEGKAKILNKPTIPAEQVNADWNATSGKAQILNKPTIPDTSGFATKGEVNAKYTKPSTGIPKTDLENNMIGTINSSLSEIVEGV